MLSVMPFMLKGMLLGKAKPSPFFADDGVTPIVAPHVLTKAERQALRSVPAIRSKVPHPP